MEAKLKETVQMGKIWTNAAHTKQKNNNTIQGTDSSMKTLSLIHLHANTANGFVPNILLKKTDDYC